MTRIDWGVSGSAIYEHGVDRGVLYPLGGLGVPWSGLVKVDEPVSGGEQTSFYYDGVKYYDFVSSEDFQAQVEAYSTPPEFAACDGYQKVSTGLYATQQRRQRFDFSYRTLIANADTPQLAYKIHLVYNCTASPSPRSYSTMTGTPSPSTRTWLFNTVPLPSATYKPTAHFVVDSRDLDSFQLQDLEDRLYGSSTKTPYLPRPTEIITILASVVPATVTANV